MAELTYRDAVIRGIAQEMARDNDVVFLGEDVAKKHDVGIARHLLGDAARHGVAISQFRHAQPPSA